MAGASAALAGVLLLGARRGKYKDGKPTAIPGANMPLAALGTLILWFGWFGFNGGSQLAIHDIENANAVAKVFVNTNTAAAAGAIGTAHHCFYLAQSGSDNDCKRGIGRSGRDYRSTG